MNLKMLWQGLLVCSCVAGVSAQAQILEVLTEDYPPFNMLGAASKAIYTFREAPMSLAFNKSAPDERITKLNDTLEVMRQEGVIDAINRKYH